MEKKEPRYSFFQNRECEFFPCHEGVDEAEFNCLFCYCPLYALGRKCGGGCICDEGGKKDCSTCAFPHRRSNYQKVIDRFDDILEVIRKNDAE